MAGSSFTVTVFIAMPETTTAGMTTCEEAAVATLVFLQQHLQQFGQNRALKPAVIIPRLYMKTANKK